MPMWVLRATQSPRQIGGGVALDATNMQTYDDESCTITFPHNGSTDVCVYDHDYTGPAWTVSMV